MSMSDLIGRRELGGTHIHLRLQRWTRLFVAFVVLLALPAACTEPAGADFLVKSQGIHISVPVGWKVRVIEGPDESAVVRIGKDKEGKKDAAIHLSFRCYFLIKAEEANETPLTYILQFMIVDMMSGTDLKADSPLMRSTQSGWSPDFSSAGDISGSNESGLGWADMESTETDLKLSLGVDSQKPKDTPFLVSFAAYPAFREEARKVADKLARQVLPQLADASDARSAKACGRFGE